MSLLGAWDRALLIVVCHRRDSRQAQVARYVPMAKGRVFVCGLYGPGLADEGVGHNTQA